jgi:hypothetical protein
VIFIMNKKQEKLCKACKTLKCMNWGASACKKYNELNNKK